MSGYTRPFTNHHPYRFQSFHQSRLITTKRGTHTPPARPRGGAAPPRASLFGARCDRARLVSSLARTAARFCIFSSRVAARGGRRDDEPRRRARRDAPRRAESRSIGAIDPRRRPQRRRAQTTPIDRPRRRRATGGRDKNARWCFTSSPRAIARRVARGRSMDDAGGIRAADRDRWMDGSVDRSSSVARRRRDRSIDRSMARVTTTGDGRCDGCARAFVRVERSRDAGPIRPVGRVGRGTSVEGRLSVVC